MPIRLRCTRRNPTEAGTRYATYDLGGSPSYCAFLGTEGDDRSLDCGLSALVMRHSKGLGKFPPPTGTFVQMGRGRGLG